MTEGKDNEISHTGRSGNVLGLCSIRWKHVKTVKHLTRNKSEKETQSYWHIQ